METTARKILNLNKLSRSRTCSVACFALAMFLCSPGMALAQVLDEITVTAQKREQNIQDVGISISAFSGDQLRELGMTDAHDIAAQTPGLNFDGGASGSVTKIPVVRAVSQNDFGPQQEPPVAVYLDNSYISTIAATGFGLFDVERVEVLKGPQGTLFGRNATGGLLHYVSTKPTDEVEGYYDLQGQDRNGFGYRAEGAISGPISENTRGRLSAFYEQHDGWWKNNLAGNDDTFESEGTFSIRGQLEIDVSDSATVGLLVNYGEMSNSPAGTYTYLPGAADPVTGLGFVLTPQNDPGAVNFVCPGCDFFGQTGSESQPNNSSFNSVGFLEKEFTNVILSLDWTIGDVLLTSITNFQDFFFDYNEDCDGSPIDFCQFPFGQDLEQFTQEIRLSGETDRLNWQAGIYYLNIDQTTIEGFQSLAFGFVTGDRMNQETTSFAVFGNLEYALSEQWRGTLGLRWTEDEKDVASDVFLGPGGPATFAFIAQPAFLVDQFSDSMDDGDWSGKLGLDYLASDELLFFGSLSRAHKAGGYTLNVNGFPLGAAERSFQPEVLTSYEVGFKNSGLAGGTARLNGALFYYDYNDYQAFDFEGIASFIRNRDASISGGELEFAASPGEGWDILLGTAVLFEKNVENVVLPGGQVVDRDVPKAPDLTVNGLIRKSWAVGAENTLAAQISFDYSDDSFSSVSNAPATFLDSYFVSNARLSYAGADSKWELAVFVKNLADEEVQNFAFDLASFGIHIQSWQLPRTVGATFRYNY